MTVNVKLFDDLEAVAADADGALDRARRPKLYDRLSWFALTVRHCDLPGTPLVARARNGVDTAWLFLQRTAPRRAEALGSWYTLDFDAVRTAERPDLLRAIAERLSGLAAITLYPVADPEPIEQAFRLSGWRVERTAASANWQLDTPDSFDLFWAERPGQLRNTIKRKAKKAGLEIAIHHAFSDAAWDDYETVYRASWKPEEGSPGFMRALARQEGAAGALRLGLAYRDGAPIAAQFWLVEADKATIHKLAYAEAARELSPGSLLSEAMFRHVIEEDRPERIDYGTGNEPYKAEWMDRSRPLYRLELLNPRRPASWPALARHAARGLVRRPESD